MNYQGVSFCHSAWWPELYLRMTKGRAIRATWYLLLSSKGILRTSRKKNPLIAEGILYELFLILKMPQIVFHHEDVIFDPLRFEKRIDTGVIVCHHTVEYV